MEIKKKILYFIFFMFLNSSLFHPHPAGVWPFDGADNHKEDWVYFFWKQL